MIKIGCTIQLDNNTELHIAYFIYNQTYLANYKSSFNDLIKAGNPL